MPYEALGSLSGLDRDAIMTLYSAFSNDPDALDRAVTEDWQDIPLAPGQGPGREAMKPMIRVFNAAFPDARITVHEIISVPGKAAVRAEITGTHRGEWFGVPPTGKAFVLPIHEFHHLENGRITKTWHMEDWFGWLRQMGAMNAGRE
ncbi:ester cyclase [Paracoccus yeei]|uniref:Ester cyclase n=1 Tax=Paracoccus yeei TaxID=147645 RepID=A0A2D2C0A3_9RHOB|nr:ester cyclase [Paracoccus yeei]ATQ55933.1 ester cyclase [Paracoccus yeei]